MKKLLNNLQSKKFIGFIISIGATISMTIIGKVDGSNLTIIIPALYIAYVGGNAFDKRYGGQQ